MGKTLCKWSRKDFGKNGKKLRKVTAEATHYCEKCARVANQKDLLCRAGLFKKKSDS